jgi:hypothetical protein
MVCFASAQQLLPNNLRDTQCALCFAGIAQADCVAVAELFEEPGCEWNARQGRTASRFGIDVRSKPDARGSHNATVDVTLGPAFDHRGSPSQDEMRACRSL